MKKTRKPEVRSLAKLVSDLLDSLNGQDLIEVDLISGTPSGVNLQRVRLTVKELKSERYHIVGRRTGIPSSDESESLFQWEMSLLEHLQAAKGF